MATVAYEPIEGIILLVIGPRTPDDAEWDQYLAFCAEQLRRGVRHALVVADGGAPTALQRKKISEFTTANGAKRAVLTASALSRGAVTALSWFNPLHRAFAPKDLAAAVSFLGLIVDAPRLARISQRIEDLRRRVA